MTSTTHIRVRERVCGEEVSRGIAAAEVGRPWPKDAQVWGWAEGAVLSGYGPGPQAFSDGRPGASASSAKWLEGLRPQSGPNTPSGD